MLSDFFKKRQEKKEREKRERQSWEPQGFLRFLKILAGAAVSAVKIIGCAAATVLCIVIICGLVFAGLLGDYLQDNIIPGADSVLDKYTQDLTSFMYYEDGEGNIQRLQRIFTVTDRQLASLDEIPEDLLHAAVAIEDQRFYEHQGVDWITTTKACLNMFFGSSSTFGGSTITQQLIKNRTGEDSITVQRKVLEIFKAQVFEQHHDKNYILEKYMNTIYLGEGCYGVKSAAATYFGKEIQDLTTAECASIIGITKNPSYYDPYIYDEESGLNGKENNRKRQLTILEEMYKQGWIETEEEYQQAITQEMVFKSGIAEDDIWMTCNNESCGFEGTKKQFQVDAEGNYRCPNCQQTVVAGKDASKDVYSWFVEAALEDVARDLCLKNGQNWDKLDEIARESYMEAIRVSGYHIYTTLDMDVQKHVDEVYTNLDEIPSTLSGQQLQSAVVVLDNKTGDVIAMSGGVGEKVYFDSWNRAVDAKLQTGSSMKPLAVYAPAFELGAISPATVIKDMPLRYQGDQPFPYNWDNEFNYAYTVYDGVRESINGVAVNVLDLIGTGYSFDFARNKFGLSTLQESYLSPFDGEWKTDEDYAPLALGALSKGVSVRDMASAFGTFANDGVYRRGRTYTKVYDTDGNLILDNPSTSAKILSDKTVNYMNYCMQGVVNSGTGTGAQLYGQNVAGKTGSTELYQDQWFCGFTGHYTAAVWCGYDTPEQIYVTDGSGNPACRMFRKVMNPIHAGLPRVSLYDSDMSQIEVCLDSGKLATEACKHDIRAQDGFTRIRTAPVYWKDRITETCDKHISLDYCITGKGAANEYCKKFAEVKLAELEKRSLVKMTSEEVEALKKVAKHGLTDPYKNDNYIYLVDKDGKPQNFKGIFGNANAGVNAPCVTCTVHTKAAWEAYQREHPVEPTDPATPTDPTDPQLPTDPLEPVTPEDVTRPAHPVRNSFSYN